jgi:hypothetical protein
MEGAPVVMENNEVLNGARLADFAGCYQAR